MSDHPKNSTGDEVRGLGCLRESSGGGQERGFWTLIVYLGKRSWCWVISGGPQPQGDGLSKKTALLVLLDKLFI